MVTKKAYILLIGLAISASTIFSTCTCNKQIIGCDNTVYSFILDIKAHPDSEIISLGDTLWLEINSPVEFEDISSNTNINYSKAVNLGSAIGFGEFADKDSVIESANSFDFKLIYGKNQSNPYVSKIREYLFVEQGDRYLFKLGIVPKKKGIFGIGLSNAVNVYREDDKCTKADFVISFKSTRQHYYLNPNIDASNSDTTQPSGNYYFKVE